VHGADAFQETAIIINHCGLTVGMDMDAPGRAEVFAEWRDAMREIARRPNVLCKIGGLGLPFWGFGFENRADPIGHEELAATWGPYVQTAIEIFGPDRCMMESDYPVESLPCGFVPSGTRSSTSSAQPRRRRKPHSSTAPPRGSTAFPGSSSRLPRRPRPIKGHLIL
jgi:predicted TIM-barrel fold metal-dependent hydrolase